MKLSLDVARGSRLEGRPPVTSGHAIEVRLNAENVDAGFSASPGEVEMFRLPTGPGLRVDSGVAEGDVVPPEFGSMFAKLSAVGHTREEALGRLKRALAESGISIKGGTTNRTYLLQLLDRDEIRASRVDVGWLDRATEHPAVGPGEHAGIALLQAAIEVYDAESEVELNEFFSAAARMRPTCRPEVGRQVEIGYLGHRYQFRVFRQGLQEDPSRRGRDAHRPQRRAAWAVRTLDHPDGENRYRVLSFVQGYSHLVEVDGVPHRISRADAGIVRCRRPRRRRHGQREPGRSRVSGRPPRGARVDEDGTGRDRALLGHRPPGDGDAERAGSGRCAARPRRCRSRGRCQRRGNAGHLRGDSAAPAEAGKVSRTRAILKGVRAGIGELKRGPGHRVPMLLQDLRRLMLGFDVEPAESKRLVGEYARAAQALEDADPERRRAEDDLVRNSSWTSRRCLVAMPPQRATSRKAR